MSSTNDESNPMEESEECSTSQSTISNNYLPLDQTPVEVSEEWDKCMEISKW